MLNYASRIKKTVSLLSEFGIDSLLIEDPVNIAYLTGLDVSLGSVLIGKKKSLIFLDARYFEAAKKKSPIDVHLVSGDSLFDELSKKTFGKHIGFDQESISFARHKQFDTVKNVTFIATPNIVKNYVRIIKSPEEIACMKKSANLTAKGYLHAVNALKLGITEQEVARILKMFWLEKGADTCSFEPIIAFGKNSACPHHRPTTKKLKMGDIVLFDLGVDLDHYASDMTRVIFFGKPDPKLVSIYEIVHEAAAKALKKCKPGTKISSLDTAARGYIRKEGYETYFPHSLGHGVGLEVHEAPFMKKNHQPLEPGMVITIEPGIYLPNLGGVRLEDTIVITENGCESITPLSTDITILS